MQINNNSQASFGYYVGPKNLNKLPTRKIVTLLELEEKVGSLKNAGIVIKGKDCMPCVESIKGHKFCAPFRAEITNNKVTVYAVDDNSATRLFNGAQGNITLNFPDNISALKAYKEINGGTIYDAAAAFAKHLDATL